MLEQLQIILQEHCHLSPGQTIVVGVSGGPDSQVLLDLLWHSGYPLVVAHFDHALRTNSAQDAARMQALAAGRGLPFALKREEIQVYAAAHQLSLEEAARMQRYRFLFEQASLVQAQAVAVGHTADDQVETLLMHLLRGSGLAGLSGMPYRSLPSPWSKDIALVRPLLGIWRKEIMDYVALRRLEPIQDSSNTDTRFFRNRLRHELLPYLESYNPGIRQNLWQTAQILRADHETMTGLVKSAWEVCVAQESPGGIAFHAGRLAHQPVSLQRALMRAAISRLRAGLRDVDFLTVERSLAFLKRPTRSMRIDLAHGLSLFMEGQVLWLASWDADLPVAEWPQIDEQGEILIAPPCEIALDNDWRLEAHLEPGKPDILERACQSPNPFEVWLDFEALQTPLRLRTRRPGERIQPLGMAGHSVKLSDLMSNAHLPQRARQAWPVLFSGNQIAWVPGIRPAHPFRLTSHTRQCLHLILSRNQSGLNLNRPSPDP